ncbi:MAG: hypothetical protein QN229_03145 [Desulfurococcaceae archaeon TW002]
MSDALTLLALSLTTLAVILVLHAFRRFRPLTNTFLALYIVFMISFILHAPFTQTPLGLTGLKYSDIVHGVFSVRFSTNLVSDKGKLLEYWFSPKSFEDLVSRTRLCPVPYLDYRFEYPPLIGFFWFLTTCASFSISDKLAITINQFFDFSSSLNYVFQSLILFFFMVLCFYYIKKIVSYQGLGMWRAIFFLFFLSTILYSTYNWDLIASGLAVGSIYYFMKKDYRVSGLLLGLSIASKILTGGLLIPQITYLLKDIVKGKQTLKNLILYVVFFLVGGLTPFILMYVMSVEGFFAFINHHASWYCENCVYALLIPDIFSPLHRYFYVFFGLTALTVIAIQAFRNSRDLISLAYASVGFTVSLNYVFTPQMTLMISPIAVLALNKKELQKYLVADTANFFLIIAFFEDSTLRSVISRIIPIKTGFNPWTIDSPTQWLAMIRNILILVTIVESMIKHKTKN